MSNILKRIVIVGGGSAGWLCAGIIAAEHVTNNEQGIEITLIESAEVPTIGVGEGTWPSMRGTLEKMGISESEFLVECDASFKQGSKFINWISGNNDHYYHPFTLPVGIEKLDLSPFWQPYRDKISFADAVCMQGPLCERNLAPKQITTAQYAYNANYGYHLDAGKFGVFLREHCIKKLGVKHIVDHVCQINDAKDGDITSVTTQNHGDIVGDLFIDCTGTSSLLLAQHYKIPFMSKKDVLFNDSALAVHVPYENSDSPIASFTLSTAQTSGWIWDIGLPSRRGVGHTYSSSHISDEQAEQQLRCYITPSIGEKAAESAMVRKISFNPGHREKFWHKNCVAVGMAAGFIEPLEASALVLVELSAQMISEQLPANRQSMEIVAKRFNQKFGFHWQQITDFLKLHYVLSKRDSQYWLDNKDLANVPESLQELLTLWQTMSPTHYDIPQTNVLFPPASFQYILYGMGGGNNTQIRAKRQNKSAIAEQFFHENKQRTQQLLSALPTNRELINKIKKFGLSKI